MSSWLPFLSLHGHLCKTMFSRMERPGKDHQVFKVLKTLRVQGYIEVRIGSGGWLSTEQFPTQKGLSHRNKEDNGLAERRHAWLDDISAYGIQCRESGVHSPALARTKGPGKPDTHTADRQRILAASINGRPAPLLSLPLLLSWVQRWLPPLG